MVLVKFIVYFNYIDFFNGLNKIFFSLVFLSSYFDFPLSYLLEVSFWKSVNNFFKKLREVSMRGIVNGQCYYYGELNLNVLFGFEI